MTSPSAASLNDGSGHREFVVVIQHMANQIAELQGQVQTLLAGNRDKFRKDITEYKSFEKPPRFDGDVKAFTDFELKLRRFVTPFCRI